jgi:hypothetical protein
MIEKLQGALIVLLWLIFVAECFWVLWLLYKAKQDDEEDNDDE